MPAIPDLFVGPFGKAFARCRRTPLPSATDAGSCSARAGQRPRLSALRPDYGDDALLDRPFGRPEGLPPARLPGQSPYQPAIPRAVAALLLIYGHFFGGDPVSRDKSPRR